MRKLFDCVDIKYEDGTFLLIPRQAYEMDLVMLGFDGTEKWIRLKCHKINSKGIGNGMYDYTATICNKEGKSWSWYWGWNGFTLVSESVDAMRNKIVECCKRYCFKNKMQFPGKGW